MAGSETKWRSGLNWEFCPKVGRIFFYIMPSEPRIFKNKVYNHMKKVEKNVLVLHSAEEMFELVDKVEDYPKFLPWYSKTEVIERKDNELKARLFMDYMRVKQSFATHNHNIPGQEIRMDLLEGPFKTLRGTWKFIDLGDDMCKVEFRLEYDFSNAVLSAMISPVFGHLAGTLVDAFIKEADRRYA